MGDNACPSGVPGAPDQRNAAGGERFRFRIVHLLYVVTLFATGVATFGGGGILPASLITIFWMAVLYRRFWTTVLRSLSRIEKLVCAFIALALACVLFSTLPDAKFAGRSGRRMAPCASHLRQIAHALTNYESCYGSYPPAYVAAEDGTRLHSWRVLILPFLEYQSLYDRYNFAELWDGPRNRKLLSEMPSVYACPARSDDGRRPTDCTSYVAVVGDRTMWPGESVTSASDVRDGLSNTVQVIEYDTQSVPWLQPEDLPLETLPQAVVPCDSTVGGGHRVRTFFTQYSTGRHVAFADGRTAYIGHGTEEAVWSGLLTVNDGRGWTNDIAQDGSVSGRRVNIGNGIRLALFVLLVLLPLASRHHVCSGTQCAEYPGKQGGEA